MSCCEKLTERAGAVTMHGNPLTLLGTELQKGDKAPDCTLVKNDLSEVKISDYAGKQLVVSVVPSLDTSVCDLQTRRFNEEAARLDNTAVITVSMDLPFAQARWCGAAGVDNLETLSDYKTACFGSCWGLLIKELRLLARAVYIVDAGGVITYKQLVKEIAEQPDYDAVLAACC